MNNSTQLREKKGSFWESVSDGWERLRHSAASALTRFKPTGASNVPAADDDDDTGATRWAMLGGDVFEADDRVVVRLEAPGMEKGDFDITVHDDVLLVRGEKRFEREHSDGRWRVLQCAYGAFQRRIALPHPVVADQAQPVYRQGVLKVTLPKAYDAGPRVRQISVS